MNLSDIKKADLRNKRILMRVDFNVEFVDGKPREKYKIESTKETIDFILSEKGVKLALLSHLGRPLDDKLPDGSFRDIYQEIGKILDKDLVFVPDCVGEIVERGTSGLREWQVLMLENVRFYEEESLGDVDFAKRLAENFDIYVNEAFGVSHRNHASIKKIVDILPSFAGLNLQKEMRELTKLRKNFERPAVAIIGGAKIETKLPMIQFFAKNYDTVLVGGKLGLDAEEQEIIFSENVVLPEDYKGDGLDIGPKSIKQFVDHVNTAKTIIWNGPLGQFEKKEFARGTEEILDAIVENDDSYKVAGGGETIQAIEQRNLLDKFNFISTGGGAMLEFLVKGKL